LSSENNREPNAPDTAIESESPRLVEGAAPHGGLIKAADSTRTMASKGKPSSGLPASLFLWLAGGLLYAFPLTCLVSRFVYNMYETPYQDYFGPAAIQLGMLLAGLPFWIATGKGSEKSKRVFIWNLTAGWTIIGWLLPLFTAILSKRSPAPVSIVNHLSGGFWLLAGALGMMAFSQPIQPTISMLCAMLVCIFFPLHWSALSWRIHQFLYEERGSSGWKGNDAFLANFLLTGPIAVWLFATGCMVLASSSYPGFKMPFVVMESIQYARVGDNFGGPLRELVAASIAVVLAMVTFFIQRSLIRCQLAYSNQLQTKAGIKQALYQLSPALIMAMTAWITSPIRSSDSNPVAFAAPSGLALMWLYVFSLRWAKDAGLDKTEPQPAISQSSLPLIQPAS
jgi:hypothetical protein